MTATREESPSQDIADNLHADRKYLQNKIRHLGQTELQQEDRKAAEGKLLEINTALLK